MADVLISGATSAAYVPVSSDVGKQLYCRVKGTNGVGFSFANSHTVGPILGGGAPVAPSVVVAPNIADLTPIVGETLHTTDGFWLGTPAPTFSYQWHRVTFVPSAPSNLTAPNIADLTPQVAETLHVTDGTWGGEPAPTLSYQWHRITVEAPEAPTNLTAPSIADITPQVGETLHTTDGTWDGEPTPTFGYQWHRVTVDPLPPANTVAPAIADTTPVQGETLHCTDGTWTGDPTITYAYQWKRDATNVGTSSADYLLVPADVGASVSCVVTATNSVASVPATSNAVGPVAAAAAPPVNTGAPAIADITPETGETLHVTDGTWTGTPAPTLAYQWFQVGTASIITSSATATNVENTVLAHALTADQSVTWTLAGGADQSRFEISGSTLRWASNGTKNFEAPNDADLNNAYVVVVRARTTTSQLTDQTVTVTVTNVIDATLTFDFQANTSTIAGTAATAVAPLTVTRSGTAAWAEKLDGTWQNFAANTARRTDKGLLIEEARTNIVLRNRDLTNASWVKTTCTAAKTQIGIDAVANSASSITATAANATCLLTCTVASSARFQTAFVKRLVGTGVIEMTTNGGTLWTAVTVTSAWTRVSIPTVTLANPVVGFRIVTSGDSIAVDMVQNEASAVFATSPISTTTAAVTRPSDVIVVNTAVAPIASWFNQSAGTLFAEGVPYIGGSAMPVFQIDAGSNANSHAVAIPNTASIVFGQTLITGAGQGSASGAGIVGTNKAAWAYELNNLAGSLNGSAAVTDTAGNVPTGMTTTRIGSGQPAAFWYGYLRKITYYGERLSNADLVTLTTL